MPAEKTLSDAFHETLKDVYWAEKQGTRALAKGAKAAHLPELKEALEKHREQSAEQIERLEQIFEMIGKTARAKTCEAMKGISEEMTEDMDDFGDTAAADSVLIGCAQAIEHYEISRYGTLKSWAKQLGHEDAVKLLDQTLQEEKQSDELLSKVAEQIANDAAGEGPVSSDDDDEEADEDAEAQKELKGSAEDEKPARRKKAASA